MTLLLICLKAECEEKIMNTSIDSKPRIISLDIIRGFALFGILFINISWFKMPTEETVSYSKLDEVFSILISVFIEKKFFSIFAFLFGVGFYIFTSRVESRGDNPRWRFARRLFSLFLIGVVSMFYFIPGSILPSYAIIGFLLLPFYNATLSTISKWLGGISALYLLSQGAYLIFSENHPIVEVASFIRGDATLIFIMFLAGFGVGKAGWIQNVGSLKREIQKIQLMVMPLFLGGVIWAWLAVQSNHEQLLVIKSITTIPTVIFYLCTMFLLLENKTISKALMPMSYVGRMALANYFTQRIIGTIIMAFMNIDFISPKQGSLIFLIAVLIFIVQIIYSMIWFKFFKMGPLEKVWRFMTYGRKKKASLNN